MPDRRDEHVEGEGHIFHEDAKTSVPKDGQGGGDLGYDRDSTRGGEGRGKVGETDPMIYSRQNNEADNQN